MFEILAVVVPIGVVGLGGYIHLWVKSNVNEALYTSIKELIEEKFDSQTELFEEKFDNMEYRLARIEKSTNGHH